MQGYNAAIIAYGQTGTGKTFTMEGGSDTVSQGIIPRAIEDMFSSIENDCAPRSKYLVRASYLQIYNEVRICNVSWVNQQLAVEEGRATGIFSHLSGCTSTHLMVKQDSSMPQCFLGLAVLSREHFTAG